MQVPFRAYSMERTYIEFGRDLQGRKKRITNDVLFRSLLLVLHCVEVPLQMQHGIAWKSVGYILISSLSIDVDAGVGELMKDIKHLQTRSKLLLQERTGDRGIPHEIIGVELCR